MQEKEEEYGKDMLLSDYIVKAGEFDRLANDEFNRASVHLALGLCGEAEELRKSIQHGTQMDDGGTDSVISEIGDVAWYASRLLFLLNDNLQQFAGEVNLIKATVDSHIRPKSYLNRARFIQSQSGVVAERIKKIVFGDRAVNEDKGLIMERLMDILGCLNMMSQSAIPDKNGFPFTFGDVLHRNLDKLAERQGSGSKSNGS